MVKIGEYTSDIPVVFPKDKYTYQIGEIVYSISDSLGDGWELCDGGTTESEEYYEAIGTYTRPDMRETRLFGNTADIGTSKQDATVAHTHSATITAQNRVRGYFSYASRPSSSIDETHPSISNTQSSSSSTSGSTGGASYSRSRTYYCNFWIYVGGLS